MATVEHTAIETFGKIPIGRRIAELMHERGDAFTIRAFAQRIGMNRETFRTILTGERPITLPELEKVTQGLRITEERLRQLDSFKTQEELESILKADKQSKAMMLRALKIAHELVEIAQGYTERCISLANLGRVQFHLQQYDNAHESWVSAMQYAEKVNDEYKDSSLLYQVTSFLMISYTIRREYTNILHTLEVVEEAFADHPEKMGYACYTRMKWHEHRGDIEKAKEYSYLALEYFKKTENQDQIGRALINVGHFEFRLGNYDKAKEVLSIAVDLLEPFEMIRLVAIKDYVKTIIMIGDNETASNLILKYVSHFEDYPDMLGKMMILKSKAIDDQSFAAMVGDDLRYGVSIRQLACKYLMEYYARKGDSESLLRYYNKSNNLLVNISKVLEEEGF